PRRYWLPDRPSPVVLVQLLSSQGKDSLRSGNFPYSGHGSRRDQSRRKPSTSINTSPVSCPTGSARLLWSRPTTARSPSACLRKTFYDGSAPGAPSPGRSYREMTWRFTRICGTGDCARFTNHPSLAVSPSSSVASHCARRTSRLRLGKESQVLKK